MQEQQKRQRLWKREVRGIQSGEVMVIGLGRFGSSLAETLMNMGHEVTAYDTDPVRVQSHMEKLSHVRVADCTNAETLERLGVENFSTVVVCIGTDIESSVLTTGALVDLKVPNIWAKAITKAHGKILERVGAHHVVYPETEMGVRTAHLVTGAMREYLALDEDFLLVEITVSEQLDGVRLGSSDLRAKHNITVVCIKPADQPFTYTTADTVLHTGDLVVIAGHRDSVERFATSR